MAQVKYKSRDELEKEIEELKTRTCDGCMYKPDKGGNFTDECGTCSRFYGDGWEKKK